MYYQLFLQQFNLAEVHSLVLFNSLIGTNQMFSLRARVNLETISMKGYSGFSKAAALLEPHH